MSSLHHFFSSPLSSPASQPGKTNTAAHRNDLTFDNLIFDESCTRNAESPAPSDLLCPANAGFSPQQPQFTKPDKSPIESIATMDSMDAEREAAYGRELLHMTQQRLHLLSSIVLLNLPVFALLHAFWSPSTRREVALTHAILLLVCLLVRAGAPQVKTLFEARVLSGAAYVLYAAGSALIGILISHPAADASLANQFIVYNSFCPILLSALLLPVSLWECLYVIAIVLLAMIGTALGSSPSSYDAFFLSHLFSTATISSVMLVLAHYGHLQRRGVFNAAFNARQNSAQLDYLSSLDPVTGGYNRRHLERVLNDEINRAARYHHALSVAMFDLDHFKIVNDTHGHACGDQVLAQVQYMAQQCVRDVDTVTRFGGDEFVVILPETDRDAALVIAQRLQHDIPRYLSEEFGVGHLAASVTLSLGLVSSSQQDSDEQQISDAKSLLLRADDLLYQAKRDGKNRVCLED